VSAKRDGTKSSTASNERAGNATSSGRDATGQTQLTELVASWTQTRDKGQRIAILEKMNGKGSRLPMTFVEDMLCLELSTLEKCALLDLVDTSSGLATEDFLLGNTPIWPQDLAATALRLWAERTPCDLWHRQLPLLGIPHLPQRVRYTIVDLSWRAGGPTVLEKSTDADGLSDYSPAFHAMLLQRAVQLGVQNAKLDALATQKLSRLQSDALPEDKSIAAALIYAARNLPTIIDQLSTPVAGAGPWIDLARQIRVGSSDRISASLTKLVAKPPRTKPLERLIEMWPAVWQRHELTSDVLAFALRTVLASPAFKARPTPRRNPNAPTTTMLWEMFAGATPGALTSALEQIESIEERSLASAMLASLLPHQWRENLAATTAHTTGEQDAALQARVRAEREAILSGRYATASFRFENFSSDPASANKQGTPGGESGLTTAGDFAARRAFFRIAAQGRRDAPPTTAAETDNFWAILTRSWLEPSESHAASLATAARQMPDVYRLAYIATLGRFRGIDFAALKLLEFVRSGEEDELRALIRALSGIGTPRSVQELIACLTRPNFKAPLQQEIITLLAEHDLSQLQAELRSALRDINTAGATDTERRGIEESLAELITPVAGAPAETSAATATSSTPAAPRRAVPSSDADLDQNLAGKIPHYRELSSEVKRALRTAQFFHLQIKSEGAPDTIDLSPLIDMQYKALELLFREMFEEPCSDLIQQGQLQRKLDVIGYARPIPPAMDEFENFIGSLPVVRDIPFFSKFKLRKMLRAICQFRPGKRFTLDGLKAFALFFLCFGRKECRYGLAGVCAPGFSTDQELAQFTRILHIFQDFRNRAAHEGFHPDASNDIEGIWQSTAEIIQISFRVKAAFDAANDGSDFAPKNRSNPQIQRRVS